MLLLFLEFAMWIYYVDTPLGMTMEGTKDTAGLFSLYLILFLPEELSLSQISPFLAHAEAKKKS